MYTNAHCVARLEPARMIIICMCTMLLACEPAVNNKTNKGQVMKEQSTADYGNWPSPITPKSLVEGVRGISSLQYDSGFVYWLESRPEEAGRQTIMRWHQDSGVEELLPTPFNARSRVHEYGGTSYLVHRNVIWFSQFDDQRLYRMTPGDLPQPITAKSEDKGAIRFAACTPDAFRDRLICVREDHRTEGEPRNELVAVAMNGRDQEG